jgi:hypothetical protein
MLLGRRAAFYETAADQQWNGVIIEQRRDLIGANGWTSRSELLTALEAAIGYVALVEAGLPEVESVGEIPTLLVENVWWAALIANGAGKRDEDQQVLVGGRDQRLLLSEVGDGSFDPDWQRALMTGSSRDSEGVVVPGAIDRFYLTLRNVASNGRKLSEREWNLLDRVARQYSLAHGDYGDCGFAAAAIEKYLVQLRESGTGRSTSQATPLARLMRRLSLRDS